LFSKSGLKVSGSSYSASGGRQILPSVSTVVGIRKRIQVDANATPAGYVESIFDLTVSKDDMSYRGEELGQIYDVYGNRQGPPVPA